MCGGETGAQGLGDPRGTSGDLLPRVLVHEASGVLEFVAALCVAGALGRRAVTLATRDLDDDAVIVEQKVDAGERLPVTAVDHLRSWPRQTGSAYDLEEAALEHRVPAGVDQQVVEQPGTPTSGSAQVAEPIDEHHG